MMVEKTGYFCRLVISSPNCLFFLAGFRLGALRLSEAVFRTGNCLVADNCFLFGFRIF